LKSCSHQSAEDLEIIVVNDGSVDESEEIIKRHQAIDSRIRVINQPNSGVARARSNGLSKARGEWILFVDGDDYLEKDAVRNLLEAATKNSADVVIGELFIQTGKQITPQLNVLSYGTDSRGLASALLSGEIQFS